MNGCMHSNSLSRNPPLINNNPALMQWNEFKSSLAAEKPPSNISKYLQALWYDGKDDWNQSHNIAQDIEDKNGSWIHAYLHRKEGDISNARYWYQRAGK